MQQAQQAPSFNLNPDLAREGSGGGAGRIDSSGAYKGIITRAEYTTASTGTRGIELDFESTSGASAKFMTLWTHNAQEQEVYGFKQLMALMTCLKLRNINPQVAQVKKYDSQAGKEIVAQATIYPELMNKPIGLILQREEYRKGSGEIGEKMSFFAPFDAQTNQLAKEILDQSPAKGVEKIIVSLKDKLLPKEQSGATAGFYQNASQSQSQQPQGNGGYADQFDDSIPF